MISTGLKGLDEVITGLRTGDNVVWQIDDIDNYKGLVDPFVNNAVKEKKKVVYMRFATHKPLLKASQGITVYELDASVGFESFSTQVNRIITQEGEGVYYVFDCLSALLSAWATDLMIGNFFMVTCPYLYDMNTVTYFSIFRNSHSFKAVARIRETTQLLMDVYHWKANYYIHPLKVWNRYSATMFLPHMKQDERFIPITDSVNAVELLSYIGQKGAESAKRNMDYWDRLFIEAEELTKSRPAATETKRMVEQLCRIMITRDKRILSLAREHFSLHDLIDIKSRLVGTGLVGGKTVGMLLARKMLSKDKNLQWKRISEPHDSFYVGSDVFYTYIVQNGLWKLRMQQKTKQGYYDAASVLRERMLHGTFPEEIMEQFRQIVEYFGASPIIIRSSSLLEDGFGNAFAGKYESIFCANQGTPEQRYIQFAEAVRKIYASTMGRDALAYRAQRGLDKLDEQMALLVQRVSGAYHKHYFFPDIAGVGVSYNMYVWNGKMDPRAGMLRLVFGLGTRAVNRVEGDYPRIAALDEPLLKPHAGMEEISRFSQHDVDTINVKENELQAVPLGKLISKKLGVDISRIATKDIQATRKMEAMGMKGREYWVLTFDGLLSKGPFTDSMRKIVSILETRYKYPVEIEFTVNFTKTEALKINLLQCRPLQTRGLGRKVEIPSNIDRDKILFSSEGYFLGGNVSQPIHQIIYIDAEGYSTLPISNKYDIARIVGKLNSHIKDREALPVLLLGPGRWGTTTPSLGVPVSFSEINNIACLGEVAFFGGESDAGAFVRHPLFSGPGRDKYILHGPVPREGCCCIQSHMADLFKKSL